MKWKSAKMRASILLALAVISFSAVDAAASQFVHDAEIERDVAWALQTDSYLGGDLVRVRVRNGIVYLSGHVTTPWERRRAEALAGGVNGVVAVENNLTYSIFRDHVMAQERQCGPVAFPNCP